MDVLTDQQVVWIEGTALRLLEEVGVALRHPLAREALQGVGCRIQGDRVYFPAPVVEKSLRRLVPHTTFSSREGHQSLTLRAGEVRFHNAGGPPFIYDLESGQRRAATLHDVAEASRLLDALPNVDVVIPLCSAQDVPAEIMTIASFEAMLRNVQKPIHGGFAEKPADVKYIMELSAVCRDGLDVSDQRPPIGLMASPVSPLAFTDLVVDTILAIAEAGMPFYPLPAPALGATSPITMAGTVAQQHAETLASLVLVAAVRPGLPVMYCSRVNPVDMRTATSSWGSPEIGLTSAMAAQLAHRLGLKCNAYGLCTSSSRLDPQFAYERLLNTVIPVLAGVDILSGVGVLENNMAVALEAAVIDDEIIGALKHVVSGVTVDEETLAFDVMRSVIAEDGVFLSQLHTVRQMRGGAVWVPGISERSGEVAGELGGGVVARAKERARQLLRTHQPAPLSDEIDRALTEIMQHARRELLGG